MANKLEFPFSKHKKKKNWIDRLLAKFTDEAEDIIVKHNMWMRPTSKPKTKDRINPPPKK